ncbi:MAG TPA: hypothetical protein VGB45_07845 [Abditibacterium sp.]|jgi:hypothetical protein
MSSTEQKEQIAGSFFALLSLALLGLAYLMVAICLFHAVSDGRLADLWAPPTGGNHGVWRHYEPARTYLDPSLLFVPPAFLFALIGLSSRRLFGWSVFVLVGCVAFFLNYLLFFSAALD